VPERLIWEVACSKSASPAWAVVNAVAIGSIAYRSPMTEKVVFVYAFAKHSAATLTPNGHEALALVAARLVTASDHQVEELVNGGQLIEIGTDEE
jgi:hypothetical protein